MSRQNRQISAQLKLCWLLVVLCPASSTMNNTAPPLTCDDLACENYNVCHLVLVNGTQVGDAFCVCKGEWVGRRCESRIKLASSRVTSRQVTLEVERAPPSHRSERLKDLHIRKLTLVLWNLNASDHCVVLQQAQVQTPIVLTGLDRNQGYVACVANGQLESCSLFDVTNLTFRSNCLYFKTKFTDPDPVHFILFIAVGVLALFVLTCCCFVYTKRQTLIVQLILNVFCCRNCYCCRKYAKRRHQSMRKQREVRDDVLLAAEVNLDIVRRRGTLESSYRASKTSSLLSRISAYSMDPDGFTDVSDSLNQTTFFYMDQGLVVPTYLPHNDTSMTSSYLDDDLFSSTTDKSASCMDSLDLTNIEASPAQIFATISQEFGPYLTDDAADLIFSNGSLDTFQPYSKGNNCNVQSFNIEYPLTTMNSNNFSELSKLKNSNIYRHHPYLQQQLNKKRSNGSSLYLSESRDHLLKDRPIEPTNRVYQHCNGGALTDSSTKFTSEVCMTPAVPQDKINYTSSKSDWLFQNRQFGHHYNTMPSLGKKFQSFKKSHHLIGLANGNYINNRNLTLPRVQKSGLHIPQAADDIFNGLNFCTLPRIQRTTSVVKRPQKPTTLALHTNTMPATPALPHTAPTSPVPSPHITPTNSRSTGRHVRNLISHFEHNFGLFRGSKQNSVTDEEEEFRELQSPLVEDRKQLRKQRSVTPSKTTPRASDSCSGPAIFEGHPSQHYILPFSPDDDCDDHSTYSLDLLADDLSSDKSVISCFDDDNSNLVTPFLSDSDDDTYNGLTSLGGSMDTLCNDMPTRKPSPIENSFGHGSVGTANNKDETNHETNQILTPDKQHLL